jgi:long-chain acyl-CoA synthetase
VRISEEDEIQVRGPNITQGYWEAPEQTALIFDGDWYKTGDQGLLDSEGYIHIKGRTKDMIVLSSGMNVFPEDLENVLKKHPDVTDAVVLGLPNGSDVEVHAVFVMDEPAIAANVVSWANQRLAEHQRVRGFTIWAEDDFPRTHTLKVKKGVVLDALKSGSAGNPLSAENSGRAESGGVRGLQLLISEIGGLPQQELAPDKALGGDLNLDSLKRVELLSAIEEELGVYLDESQVGADTTMGQLEEIVQHGSRSGSSMNFPAWGMRSWCRALRGTIQRVLLFPVLRATNRLRVTGVENLEAVSKPVLFVSNHCLFLDSGLILKSMPSRVRRRLAIAAAAEPMRNPVWAVFNPLVGNGFPFSREDDVRASLNNLGHILDNGWSVLIYPEGQLSIGGPMKAFKGGAGLIAVEGGVSVVPIHVQVNRFGTPPLITFLRRSDVEVRFGEPISFAPETSYIEAAAAMEEAVTEL